MGEKFGWNLAAASRRRSPHRADKWHLDEVVVSIAGKKHWLWRAVDADGFVLAILAQSSRDKKAAKRLMRKLLKNAGRAPRVMVTDKLKSYGGARAAMGLRIKHRQHNGLNSRAETNPPPLAARIAPTPFAAWREISRADLAAKAVQIRVDNRNLNALT